MLNVNKFNLKKGSVFFHGSCPNLALKYKVDNIEFNEKTKKYEIECTEFSGKHTEACIYLPENIFYELLQKGEKQYIEHGFYAFISTEKNFKKYTC